MGLNKVSWKSFIAGTIMSAVLFSGIGYASSTFEVSLNPVKFFFNGEELETERENYIFNGKELVPASLMYKGTLYLPTRFISEGMGLDVAWDNQTKTVMINDPSADNSANKQPQDVETLQQDEDYQVVDTSKQELPETVEKWVEDHKQNEYQGSLELNGSTYILLTRGQQSSAGYLIELDGIISSRTDVTVKATYTYPQPGHGYPTVITYPSLLIKLNGTSHTINFDIDDSQKSGSAALK